MNQERIQKILSARGVASRRTAEKLILAGRVTVNGVQATLGQSARPGYDDIAVDGASIESGIKPVYIMLNKPRGYVTTVSDEHGRRTVMRLVEDAGAKVYPVGRLDMDSEGLLLMTNDGRFANVIMHPSHMKAKTYQARVYGDVSAAVPVMRGPMAIDGYTVQAASVEILECVKNNAALLITINEGRNRQIRKMCAICGLKVLALRRVAIGTLELGSLKSGQWRYLTEAELESIYE